jgi:hypothetical protein
LNARHLFLLSGQRVKGPTLGSVPSSLDRLVFTWNLYAVPIERKCVVAAISAFGITRCFATRLAGKHYPSDPIQLTSEAAVS